VTVPGDLLRFDILVNVSSDVNPLAADVLALKVTATCLMRATPRGRA
jgi:hypothetical protein